MKDKNGGNADAYREICGLPISTYFSANKMKWLLDNVDGLKDEQNLTFGTIESYIIARLTECSNIVTDASNASRTMLMDIDSL
jgi:glycerol kinase